MSDKQEFLKVLTMLSTVFKTDLSVPALEAYWIALQEYSIDQLKAAARMLLRTRVYGSFPKPAEFIRAIEGDGSATGLLLAQRIIKWAATHGRYSPPDLDSAAQRTLDLTGGYEALCAMKQDETQWWAKRFAEIYVADQEECQREIAGVPRRALGDQKQIEAGER